MCVCERVTARPKPTPREWSDRESEFRAKGGQWMEGTVVVDGNVAFDVLAT